MKRRDALITLASIGALPGALCAQATKAAGTKLVGILSPNPPQPPDRTRPMFERFAKLGWVLGKNLAFERPTGREAELDEMASSLVRNRVDAIWAIGPEAAVAAARAAREIPIVFWGVALPRELGLIESLARPGRNVTGVAFFTGPELFSKQMEFLKLVAPRATRLAWLSTPSASRTVSGEFVEAVFRLVDRTAASLGLEFQRHFVQREEDFPAAFEAITAARAQSLGVSGTALTWRNRALVAQFANRARLPSAFNQPEFVEAGGLFSYGADTQETIYQTIQYIDRVLRGARPAELPVELPSKYELVLNLRTASALGLQFPQSVLVRADRVIE